MERNGTLDKYEHIDYYLIGDLDKEDKDKEIKNKIFDKKNFFLFTKNEEGKLCENVYERKIFQKKYDFIIVENHNVDKKITNFINVSPIIGLLIPKNVHHEAKIKESIESLNRCDNTNTLSRILKSLLINYKFKVTNEKGISYDKRYEIIPANDNFSNNNFQQQINYSNNNNINYNSGVNYNQNNNFGMFNNNIFQNTGNSVVNNKNYNNNNNINYNNYNFNNNYNNMNQNNFINMNNNQGNNNNSFNSNFYPNYGNGFNNNNQNNNNLNNDNKHDQNQNNAIYLFPQKGLNNIGSTCYMNATLQCLLHVSELTLYFIREYPNDKNNLKEKNKLIESKGQISNAFYELVEGVCKDEYIKKMIQDEFKNKNIPNKAILHNSANVYSDSQNLLEKMDSNLGSSTYVDSRGSSSFSPYNFKKVLGRWNSQFKKFEANDSKDLILYLMQTMHEELNYFGGNNSNNLARPNQYDKISTFMYFMNSYNALNFSIISQIFYGTYENVTLCNKCKKLLYNYQKFEFISFGMYDYKNKEFDIYNGFEDNSKPQQLKGENQFYCNTCKKLEDAEITSRIIQPPNKLIINIDYGKNKAFKPSEVKFNEEIDITRFVCFDFGVPIKYKIIGVCTHLGYSGSSGHYIAYCKHRESGKWYNFNDSYCGECNQSDIYRGSPYLLLYEKI